LEVLLFLTRGEPQGDTHVKIGRKISKMWILVKLLHWIWFAAELEGEG
jgi:hypothetical protein